MNHRLKKKVTKRNLHIAKPFKKAEGHFTPYACPNCNTHYTYKQAFDMCICPVCSQHLSWFE